MAKGACVVKGVCMVRGHAWQGVCMDGEGGVHGWRACMTGEMATAVGGTHPTGMHSCLHIYSSQMETNVLE